MTHSRKSKSCITSLDSHSLLRRFLHSCLRTRVKNTTDKHWNTTLILVAAHILLTESDLTKLIWLTEIVEAPQASLDRMLRVDLEGCTEHGWSIFTMV